MDLSDKARFHGLSLELPHQCVRLDLHGIVPCVGQQARTKVEDGAVVKAITAAQHSDVVQMPVLVAEQHIHLEQQRQIGAEAVKSRQPLNLLHQPRKAALKIGQAVYRGLPVRANAFSQQLRKGQDGLAWA